MMSVSDAGKLSYVSSVNGISKYVYLLGASIVLNQANSSL